LQRDKNPRSVDNFLIKNLSNLFDKIFTRMSSHRCKCKSRIYMAGGLVDFCGFLTHANKIYFLRARLSAKNKKPSKNPSLAVSRRQLKIRCQYSSPNNSTFSLSTSFDHVYAGFTPTLNDFKMRWGFTLLI